MASCSALPPNGNGDDNDEYGWKKTLPPGHKFYPTDVELIIKYLKRKAQNRKIMAGIISDLDIYNYHPQELEAYAFNHGNGRMYFFAPFKKKTNEGWRGDRTVRGGRGYWKASQARATMKDCNNTVIGTKQSLVYYNGKSNKTSWLMSEFRFPSDFDPLPLYNQTKHELVLCVIYHHGKRAIIDDNQESESNANWMEDLQSTNFIATPTQNANLPLSLPKNFNFSVTSTFENPNFSPSSAQDPNFIATSTLQNPNFSSASPQNPGPNFSPSSIENPNFTAISTLQNFNFSPSSTRNPDFISTLQNPNHPPSSVQSPNFIATSTLQNPNFPPYSSLDHNFIAASTLQNPNFPSSSTLYPNFITTSIPQSSNFSPSLAQNPLLQDACELLPLPTSYNNTDTTNHPLSGSVENFDCEPSKWSQNYNLPWSYEEIVSYLYVKDDSEDDITRLDILTYDSVANQQTLLHNNTPPQISPNNVNSNMSTATNPNQSAGRGL